MLLQLSVSTWDRCSIRSSDGVSKFSSRSLILHFCEFFFYYERTPDDFNQQSFGGYWIERSFLYDLSTIKYRFKFLLYQPILYVLVLICRCIPDSIRCNDYHWRHTIVLSRACCWTTAEKRSCGVLESGKQTVIVL